MERDGHLTPEPPPSPNPTPKIACLLYYHLAKQNERKKFKKKEKIPCLSTLFFFFFCSITRNKYLFIHCLIGQQRRSYPGETRHQVTNNSSPIHDTRDFLFCFFVFEEEMGKCKVKWTLNAKIRQQKCLPEGEAHKSIVYFHSFNLHFYLVTGNYSSVVEKGKKKGLKAWPHPEWRWITCRTDVRPSAQIKDSRTVWNREKSRGNFPGRLGKLTDSPLHHSRQSKTCT